MLILFPDFLWLRLMRKALIGEIARKMNAKEDELKEMMEAHDKKRAEIADERAAKRKARLDAKQKKDKPQYKE